MIMDTEAVVCLQDLARLNKSAEVYTNQRWFKEMKGRWNNYFDNLEKHWLKIYFRSRSGGTKNEDREEPIYQKRYDHFPEYYRWGSSFFVSI